MGFMRAAPAAALVTTWSISLAIAQDARTPLADEKLIVAAVDISEELKQQVLASTLTDLLIRQAKRSGTFKEVEPAPRHLQQVLAVSRAELAAGRVPAKLRDEVRKKASPSGVLLTATASRAEGITVMTGIVVELKSLTIIKTAEVRGMGKAGNIIDFPMDLVAQLAGKGDGATLMIMFQKRLSREALAITGLRSGPDEPGVGLLKYVSPGRGFIIVAKPEPDRAMRSAMGWKYEWKDLPMRTEITISLKRADGALVTYGNDNGVLMAASAGAAQTTSHCVVVSPWETRRVVRINADDLSVISSDIDQNESAMEIFAKGL
jgi:hypothetical protein